MKIKCIDTYGQSNLTLNKVYEADLDKSEEHSKNMMTELYLLENDNGEIHGYLKDCFEEYLKTNDNDFRILTGNKEYDKLFENGIPIEHINKLIK
jgi:hypothetical protein